MGIPSSAIRVLVVDDSALVREGLRSVLSTHAGIQKIVVVGEADCVAGAVREATRLNPDVVLLDIRLPDGSGLDACRRVLNQLPAVRVLVLTSVATDQLIQQAIEAGAQGYLMKEIDPARLVGAISDAAAGKSVFPPEITERVVRLLKEGSKSFSVGVGALSPQESRVLALVAEGLTNKEVAQRLELSENTVKNYLVSVFDKLQVKRRSQATALLIQSRTGGH